MSSSSTSPFRYTLGSLFPGRSDVQNNVVLSDSLRYNSKTNTIHNRSNHSSSNTLKTSLAITTKAIEVEGIDRFLNNFLIPGLTDTKNASSLFNRYFSGVTGGWTGRARNQSIADALLIGYQGPGADQASNNNSFWSGTGQSSDGLLQELSDPANYKPKNLWNSYQGSSTIRSEFDHKSLDANLAALKRGEALPKAWRPAYLYTYGLTDDQGKLIRTSYPGPTLMLQPGDTLRATFSNRIRIPGYNKRDNQLSTYIPSTSPGDNGGANMGGTATTNTHLHGAHVNATGFGDNVVARYTSGQKWTTIMNFPEDTGKGSYWYHPHYHPSVNEQLYGGLSGFTQIGDPLSLIPGMKDVPRNLALIKTLNLKPDPQSGDLKLTTYDYFLGQKGAPKDSFALANNMTVNTVNGEFQPTGKSEQGGWQSFTLTNQTNITQHNIAFTQLKSDGSEIYLPLYVYGEDGHQLPQIRRVVGALASSNNSQVSTDEKYKQLPDVVSLPPGKRMDVLVYLPEGTTNISSIYGINSEGPQAGTTRNVSLAAPKGGSANLNATAQQLNQSAGPLARIKVKQPVSQLSADEQDAAISQINAGINVQTILPTTPPSDYDSTAIPSVDLFANLPDETPLWTPLRKRSFSFSNFALVGPKEEWDGPTQEALAQYETATGQVYERYRNLPIGQPGLEDWLGYSDGPFLINDHVFPNGNLTIAQLGTMEEWQLRNWSQASPSFYIAHPFHIHLNDYQTLDSDTELSNKRNLEDTTILNSSGYRYYNTATGTIQEHAPIKGKLHTIAEALDPSLGYNPQGSNQLATWGAVDQTVRMLFQDYLGTYVFHCHILAHEDAGMMQAVMVVENTDSSWLAPQEGFATQSNNQGEQTFNVRLAQSFDPYTVRLELGADAKIDRLSSGDLTGDYYQDLVVSSQGDGKVRVIDGETLKTEGETEVLASFKPYSSSIAPWAFADDFSGDGQRDLITGGFQKGSETKPINLDAFTITAWKPTQNGSRYSREFSFKPFSAIDHNKGATQPLSQLSSEQFSFITGDFNLDNFNDFAMAYAIKGGGFRVTILDGAAFALLHQTGELEGGYFPNRTVLADAIVQDASLKDLNTLVLSAGFNSYAQNAIENLLVSTNSSGGQQLLTLNLNAGHFITTSLPDGSDSSHHHGGHSSHSSGDERITNLDPSLMPLNLSAVNQLSSTSKGAPTASFGGAFATGSLLAGQQLMIAQGNTANGIASTSSLLTNTAQQLVIDLGVIEGINGDEITGVIDSTLSTTYSAAEVQERGNLSSVLMAAYGGLVGQAGTLARWAGGSLGQGASSSELVDSLLSDPTWAELSRIHFGGSLNSLSADAITGITVETLYGRTATAAELARWSGQVAAGLDRDLLPLAIAQSTTGQDIFRLAYLSAAGQWLAAQSGTQAMQSGSFGQGFQADEARFSAISDLAFSASSLSSWEQADRAYDLFRQAGLDRMIGTPVSKSGFF